jgi:hypothetical protein
VGCECIRLASVAEFKVLTGVIKPFNAGYRWGDTPDNLIIGNPAISTQNTYIGGPNQQATSVISVTDQNCYEVGGTGCFSVYGFEYKPGFDNAYITWVNNNVLAWTMMAGGMGPDDVVQISARPISQEPMVRPAISSGLQPH